MLPAQLHRIAKRGDEHFAVWTGAEMSAKLGANIFGQLIIDVGGQLPKNVQASLFTVLVRFFSGHEPVSLGRHPACE